MNKDKSRKSVNSGGCRSRKQSDNSRQRATKKVNVRGVKAQSSPVRATRTINESASRRAKTSPETKAKAGKAPIPAPPMTVNPQLLELEKGRKMKQLHEQGLSLADLARKFECSKSLVRDLVKLASLSKELEEAYVQGELGRKKVLKMARVREKQDESETPVVTAEPESKASKNSIPVLTEEEREKRVTENAQLIIDWVHSIHLAACDWEGFFQQVKFGLYGPFRWIFRQEAPKPHEINTDEDPWKVIEICKVGGENPNLVPDMINNAVTWLARWIQRVIPDRAIMEDAIDQARAALLREARKARWS